MSEVYMKNILKNNETVDELTRAIDELTPRDWESTYKNPWYMLKPMNQSIPSQGWKGHISAILGEAIELTKVAVSILIRNNCAFKIVCNKKQLSILNGIHYPMSGANKFITFYPKNEEMFFLNILELKEALKEFKGPRIHTDFQCGLNSTVHYRYGAFKEISRFDTSQNRIVQYIRDNSDKLVEDKRNPWYEKPDWIKDPFEGTKEFEELPVLSNIELKKVNKYEFKSILSRGNKGNVYSAKCRESNKFVIIKEANPLVLVDNKDYYACDCLKNELEILELFYDIGYVPKAYEVFKIRDKNFLVQEKINGERLDFFSINNYKVLYDDKVKIMYELIKIVEMFHEKGYVIMDLKPSNLLVVDGQRLKIIDLELVHSFEDGMSMGHVGSVGFYNAEFINVDNGIKNDWFATIISIITLFIGTIPYFNVDSVDKSNAKRCVILKVIQYVEFLYDSNNLSMEVYRVVKHLIENKLLVDYKNAIVRHAIIQEEINEEYVINTVVKGLFYHCNDNFIKGEERLWESTEFGKLTNKFCIQHGIIGVSEFLINYINSNGDKEGYAKKTLAILKSYILENIDDLFSGAKAKEDDSFLFGSYGIIWGLVSICDFYNDNSLFEKAIKLMYCTEDQNKGNIDFALGESGRAYSELKLWISTKEKKYYINAVKRVCYIVDSDITILESKLMHKEKLNKYGFAHGVSGIAYVVYLVGKLSGQTRFVDYALGLVEAVMKFYDEEMLEFPNNRMSITWCNGLSGVATSLVRINQFENRSEISSFLEKVPKILLENMLSQSPCQCHGNSSSIEALIDLYDITKNEVYFKTAKKISTFIFNQNYFANENSIVFPSETKLDQVYDYGVGTTGVAQAILRVNNGDSKRLFMLNEKRLLEYGERCRNNREI